MFYVKGDQVENRWTPLSHGAGEIKTKPSSRQVIEAKVVLHDRAVRYRWLAAAVHQSTSR